MNHADYRTRQEMIDAGLSLDEQNDILMEKIAHLKSQVNGAKADAASGNGYSDNDWFNRASHALRMTQIEHQKCLREIGDRNKAARHARGQTAANRFVDVARRLLDRETFSQIMDEATQEQL